VTVPFVPDIFSISRPSWRPANSQFYSVFATLSTHLPAEFFPLRGSPEESQTLGINSNNFRISAQHSSWILKRLPNSSRFNDVNRTLKMMAWLADEGLPVPRPKPFSDGSFLYLSGSSLWCLFPYLEGNYFSGAGVEIETAAEAIGRLTSVLKQCPVSLQPSVGPLHLTDSDDMIINICNDCMDQWGEIFGEEHAQILKGAWETLSCIWSSLRTTPPNAGLEQAVHFDLHPHNLLMNRMQVTGILDFESCRLMPVGYALAFAGLKLCRQAVAETGNLDLARLIGNRFTRNLCNSNQSLYALADKFKELALTEVLRRICLIIRLNIEINNKAWNKILPIQLNHLQEAELLFG